MNPQSLIAASQVSKPISASAGAVAVAVAQDTATAFDVSGQVTPCNRGVTSYQFDAPSQGVVSGIDTAAGTGTLTPPVSFTGEITMQYSVLCDGHTKASGTVTFTVS